MTKAIETIVKPRIKVLEIIKPLSIEQVNAIPTGFRNNIIWNLGHMIAAQQSICYMRAGIPTVVDEAFFNRYKPGSKPEEFLDATELEKIIGLLSSTITQLEADLTTNMFANYPSWTTRYGVDLNNVSEAVAFLPFHEGLHIGTIVAMAKIV